MSKKSKTMIIALGILVLLGAGYYGATIHSRNRAEAAFEETILPTITLGNLASSDVVKIEASGKVFQRQDALWELVSLNGEVPPERIGLDQARMRSLSFILATVWAEQLIDEEPEDISVYGLDIPASRVVVTDYHGNTAVYLVGDMTPSRTAYFVMEEGNPTVFAVNTFSVRHLQFTLDDVRDTALFPPHLPFHALTRMHLESPAAHIEIRPMPESRPRHLISAFTNFIMTSPYSLPRAVDGHALQTLLTPLNNRRIEEFVNASPSSLSPYGLDNPVRFLLEFGEASIELLIGNQTGAARYAKLAGAPGVFTISGMEPFVNLRPFILLDKLALLMGINDVAQLSITGGERPLNAEFQDDDRGRVFYLNGRRADTNDFRNWFQNVIILSMDAEIPAGSVIPASSADEHIVIEHRLKNGERVSVTLVPFNRDFYALSQEGTMEFLVARSQVRRIFQSAEIML